MNKAGETQTFWAYEASPSLGPDIALLDNVQFIYELILAQLELKSLGVDFETEGGLRAFRLINTSLGAEEKARRRSAYCKAINKKPTDYFHIIQRNRTRSVNQYLTHWIYPYKGKFHPQMIRALLNIMGLGPGDTVLDPFMGSGTTALEAQLLGINCVGVDISPLCVLQSKVKAESIEVLDGIMSLGQRVRDKTGTPFLAAENNALGEFIEAIAEERTRNFYKMAGWSP